MDPGPATQQQSSEEGRDGGPLRLTRRALLLGVAASGTVVALGAGVAGMLYLRDRGSRELPIDPTFFLRIDPDDTVTVVSKHLEMGQGITTGLAMLVAEELDADWAQVRAALAPADQGKYFNGQWGRQETAASSGMSNSWMQMRCIGAAARSMLVRAAASEWQVDPSQISVRSGRLMHHGSGRESGFGAFAAAAMRQPVPRREDLRLKPRAEWRLIGGSLPRLDTIEKTDGTAQFASDVRRPDMLRAVVLRAPRFGGKLVSFDASRARSVPGVQEVIEIPDAIAVLADNTWAAIRGVAELSAEWDDHAAEARSSADILEHYRALSRTTGVLATNEGDVEAAWGDAWKTLDFEFSFPYLAHAPMEPLSCVMERTPQGVTVWAGCQAHTLEQQAVARVFGIGVDRVKINTTYAGASFGRRTYPLTDWIPELAHIVDRSTLGRPVQLVWTREDDIRGGAYRPLAYHRGRAGLDESGNISVWFQSVVCQSLAAGTPWSYREAEEGRDSATIGGIQKSPYRVANHRLEVHSPKSPVTVGFWRSVGNSHNAFVLETIVDELAHLAGEDPLAFRLRHLRDERRRNVLQTAGQLAGWGAPQPANAGRGIACFAESNASGTTEVAIVVEVTAADDAIHIDRVLAVIDCGLAVNPSLVKSQVEGSIIFALSAALRNEIVLEGGLVQQSNFHDYAPARMSEVPRIEVHILESDDSPRGVGEGAVSMFAPALGNAIFAATGKRLRDLPMRLRTV
jgi:isoquinoline 1-oxidoreductase subunit beta